MSIIGIGGKKEAGKNTAALALKEIGYTELSLAYPLKRAVQLSFQIPMERLDSATLKDAQFVRPVMMTTWTVGQLLNALTRYRTFSPEEREILEHVGHGRMFSTAREILQFVGTDLIRRHIDDEFWTKALQVDMEPYPNVVIPDVRFPNERKVIRSLGGKLVLIKRPGTQSSDTHSSENSLGEESEYDVVLENTGTIEALQAQLMDWYNRSEKA